MEFFDDPPLPVTSRDFVVCGPYVGWLLREGKRNITLYTKREIVEVPADAPMRPVMPREIAERVFATICREGEDGPSMATRPNVWGHRDVMIAEMAVSLGKSERAIRAALRRRDPTVAVPDSPWLFAGHEYIGAFRVERGLIFSDRCYVNREHLLLVSRTPALPGPWHAYIRYDPNFSARTLGMLVVHADHFDLGKEPGEKLGCLGVDAGCAVVVDMRVLDNPGLIEALTTTSEWEEGLLEDVGCFAFTYDGDGMYNVRVIKSGDAVVAARVNLTRDEAYDYHHIPPPKNYQAALDKEMASAGPAKPYSIYETFVEGERVAHKKFGEGLVMRIVAGGKVEVAFAEGLKLLLHGQKK